jgi:hypothetical protein
VSQELRAERNDQEVGDDETGEDPKIPVPMTEGKVEEVHICYISKKKEGWMYSSGNRHLPKNKR